MAILARMNEIARVLRQENFQNVLERQCGWSPGSKGKKSR